MRRLPGAYPEPGGFDPLDVRLDAVGGPTRRLARPSPFDRRLALGLSPRATPGLPLLLLGVALGPQGVNLLSPAVLSFLNPAVSVALAALGVLVGLDLNVRTPGERRLLAAATLEAGLTVVVVTAGTLFIAPGWTASGGLPPWIVALLLGICASSSATHPSVDVGPRAVVTRIGDLDDVLPILLGGLALAFLRESSLGAFLWLAVQATGVVLLIATAGRLLMTPAASETEQRVFAVATLLLIGGTAEYLSLSALLCGLIAGAFWERAGGLTRDCIRRDVRHIQHPLLVLVLLVAGARVDFSTHLFGLVAAYVLLRLIGKLAGGWLARRIDGVDAPRDLGFRLLSPGIVGVAVALNTIGVAGPAAAPVLAVAVAGALASELIAGLVRPREGVE